MKINRLPSEIFNRIAAGEVVESPASIVKELAENAVDAGATQISIAITSGGIERISVVDNGCGIEFDDMPTAFLPHSTSKISVMDDLDTIATLGFRGEALPSIASVADVTMVTRTKDGELGGRIAYRDGRLVEHEECGAILGTSVVVESLFRNIPARKKFLGKPSREETKIVTLIEHMSLANPNIVFKFDSETKHFESYGEDLQSAVFAVYGDTVLKNTVKVELEDGPIRVEGYTCLPTFTKPSKSYQHIIINGRYVESADVQYAVYSVYSAYLMKRQYPLYVLHITIPYDMVDVNVHPSKMQVKFADAVKVKSIVARAVRDAVLPKLTDAKRLDSQDFSFESAKQETSEFGKSHTFLHPFLNVIPLPTAQKLPPIAESKSASDIDLNQIGEPIEYVAHSFEDKKNIIPSLSDLYEKTIAENQADSAAKFISREAMFVGKLFNTYLILEREEQCYFVDQHAAHEKLLYDKLLNEYETKRLQTQPLMIPFVFDVSASDAELIGENIGMLEDCGFGISPFGEYTFALSYLPYLCSGIDLQSFVSDILLLVNSREKSPMLQKERLMQAACKAAAKGEIDDLSQSEIDALLNEMSARNITLFCPHGRPIAVCFSKKEIEKWFKRIV